MQGGKREQSKSVNGGEVQIAEKESGQVSKESIKQNDNKLEYEYEHIADRMLRQLEEEYWNVQKYDQKHIPSQHNNSEQPHPDNIDDAPEQAPEGYHNLDNSHDNDNNLNSDSDSPSSDDQDQQEEHQQQKVQQITHTATYLYTNINTLNTFQQQSSYQTNPQNMELVEVGPVPESAFQVPPPQLQDVQIDCDKIKSFALSLNIDTPDWAKDPTQLEAKIRHLFQKPSIKHTHLQIKRAQQ